MVKNAIWQEADQLAIYKRGREVVAVVAVKHFQLLVRAGVEHGQPRPQGLLLVRGGDRRNPWPRLLKYSKILSRDT